MDSVAVHGSAHFTIGFVFGYVCFRLILLAKAKNYRVSVYGPLLPFGVGFFFAIPNVFERICSCELQEYIGVGVNVFGAYGWLHYNDIVKSSIDNLNRDALINGVIYLMIIQHYISLIKNKR